MGGGWGNSGGRWRNCGTLICILMAIFLGMLGY
jgi:hypothetical protein